MLTSFFSKSNPINYLILGILIFIGYGISVYSLVRTKVNIQIGVEHIIFSVLLIFSMLLLDFIIRKNYLTKNSTYGILFFSCFLMADPIIFSDRNILISNIFILLSLRRILSFRTDKNIEKKILDASIWITVASFFYFWSLLLFFVLYFALVKKQNINYKQILIPIVGFLGMYILAIAYYSLVNDSISWTFIWESTIETDFIAYNNIKLIVPIAVMSTFLIWTGISRIFKINSLPKKEKPNAIILLFAVIITLIISLSSNEKTGAELLFTLGPLAIISANYIENSREFYFKETLLWVAVLLPIIMLIL